LPRSMLCAAAVLETASMTAKAIAARIK